MSTQSSVSARSQGEKTSPAVQSFRLVLALAQELRTLMDQRLQPSGLTTQQAALLTVIEVMGQPPTLTDAARKLAMSHQNLKQLAVALERKGFIEIVPDEADARSKRMQTTKKHRAFWSKRNTQDHDAVSEWFSGLEDSEVTTLLRLLGKALESARKHRLG